MLTLLLASFHIRQNAWQFATSKEELISKVFPNIDVNYKTNARLSKWAILAAKNKNVDDLNTKIQSQINGQIH
jgi:PIF1 helicase.